MPTKGQEYASDIAQLLRSRNPLIWIVTTEEGRVERLLIEAAAAAAFVPHTWDIAQGVCNAIDGKPVNAELLEPGELLSLLLERISPTSQAVKSRNVTIMRDLPVWISGPTGAATQRRLRNFVRKAPSAPKDRAQAVIILTSSRDVPPELSNDATVIEWPLPDREEIAAALDAAIRSLPEFEMVDGQPDTTRPVRANAMPNGTRDAAIEAAIGLTHEQAASCFARSLLTRKIDPVAIAKQKRMIIGRERVVEWFDPLPGGLNDVGGLENLKSWLIKRRLAFTPAARKYGLRTPKGVFLAGISGCGKSLTAKATATAFSCPLIKIDLGALKSKFVGDSEQNLRKAFSVIEAIGRCVVWFDEIEKAMQGATSGSSDGGVSSDALGAVLTWMQERKGEAFVMATANDISNLPPELLRKGRFDEVFFVDLPNSSERAQILITALRSACPDALVDVQAVAAQCFNFTGAEIAELVPDALFTAFEDDARPLETDDLIAAANAVVPLATMKSKEIEALRTWASTRARRASKEEAAEASAGGRQIDLM